MGADRDHVMLQIVWDARANTAKVKADDDSDMIAGVYFLVTAIAERTISGPEVTDAAGRLARVIRRKVGFTGTTPVQFRESGYSEGSNPPPPSDDKPPTE